MEVPLTPLQFTRRALALYPQRLAVVEGGRRRSYAEHFERVARLAKGLQDLGVRRHDRIAALLGNSSAALEAVHAVAAIGAVLVPLSPRLGREDYAWILRHCRVRIALADAALMDTLDAARRELLCVERFVSVGGWQHAWLRYEELLGASNGVYEPADVDERDPIALNYVVRGEVRPRAVVITHRNAWIQALGTLVHTPIAADERYLWTLPMHRGNGWAYPWSVTAMGAAHVFADVSSPASLHAALASEAVSLMCLTPRMLAGLADCRSVAPPADPLLSHSRRRLRVYAGGGVVDPEALRGLRERCGWDLRQVYVLSETGGIVALDEGEATPGPVAAGQGVETLTGAQLRLLDEQGSEVPADGASIGEIHLRGNAVMFGYYEDPPETARALRGGWLRTGDLAVRHPDGRIELRGRRRSVIHRGDEAVSPAEIEHLLLPVAGVREVVVTGRPDPEHGEAPHAFVLVRKGCTVTAEQLAALAEARLAPYKRPVAYHFVAAIPRLKSGAVDRAAVARGELDPE